MKFKDLVIGQLYQSVNGTYRFTGFWNYNIAEFEEMGYAFDEDGEELIDDDADEIVVDDCVSMTEHDIRNLEAI
jgi:hypothetical protein